MFVRKQGAKLIVQALRNALGIGDHGGRERLLRDRNGLLLVEGVPREMHVSLLQSKESPITTHAHSVARMEFRSLLPNDDVSGNHLLTTE